MKVLISGTAGADGWPLPDCGCASCARLIPGHRRPTMIVLADSIRLPPAGPLPSGYRTTTDADGLTITTPDGDRILYAAPLPTPPPGRYGEQTEPRSPASTDIRQESPTGNRWTRGPRTKSAGPEGPAGKLRTKRRIRKRRTGRLQAGKRRMQEALNQEALDRKAQVRKHWTWC